MLPIKNKRLTAQIITTTTLITIMLLSSYCPTTESLPITSKPIESTAENLAWEAWLMVPVGQQQKTRKVTPKSIFIVPQKKNQSSSVQCPPGEHFFESRCIPTVNIDTEQILLTQLTNLVLSSGDYDYDYEEDGNDTPGAEKLEGNVDIVPSSNGDKADEPLKFDIFRDNFPIGSSGSGDSSGIKDSEDENLFFTGERRRRPPVPPETAIPDLEADSSSYGSHNQSDYDVDEDAKVFLSGINAILIPAVSDSKGKDQSLNFSIYQDVANRTIFNGEVEVVSRPPDRILAPDEEKDFEMEHIWEDEGEFLFAHNAPRLNEKAITTAETSDTTTDQAEVETTTLKLMEDEDVESKTEFTRSITEVAPIEEETSISTTDPTEITSTVVGDITSTIISNEETTMIVNSNEEITTMTNSMEETTTNTEEITTMPNSKEETTMISDFQSTTSSDLKDRTPITTPPKAEPVPNVSDNRFLYHRQTPPPPMIDISAELKMINDLVARNRKSPTEKPQPPSLSTPSVESTTKSREFWSKIIPSSPNAINPTSVIPPSSTSTSSNIENNSSSSSTISSTNDVESQGTSPPLPTSSTSPPIAEVSQSSPFWWLPTGWRVDRTDVDRSLLLRFWSALSGISGGQTKV